MARKSLPPHLRKFGPGTGGRNWDRDKEICALKKSTGMSHEAIAKKYGISRGRVGQIVAQGERDKRAGRTRWMSAPERHAEAQKRLGLDRNRDIPQRNPQREQAS